MTQSAPTIKKLGGLIYEVRSLRVILDADLADVYGVETRVLIQALKRNRARFPEDFVFQLNNQEVAHLKSQSVISRSWGGRRRSLPYAFTEHGAVMAATILNSPVAVRSSILVVRAFVHMRQMISEHSELRKRLLDLEARMARRFSEHESELREIRYLMRDLEKDRKKKRNPLGFRPSRGEKNK